MHEGAGAADEPLTSPLSRKHLLHLVDRETTHPSTGRAPLPFTVQVAVFLSYPGAANAVATVTLGPVLQASKLVPTAAEERGVTRRMA